MIDRIVISIIEYQLKLGTIRKCEVNIYRYGYKVLIEECFNIFLALFISNLLGKVTECIFLLIVLIPMRSFCGGYHAKYSWQCVILSNVSILLILIFSDLLIMYYMSIVVYVLNDIIMAMIIIYFSPVGNNRKKLSKIEKRQLKKYAIMVIFIEVLLGIGFLIMGHKKIFNIIVGVHLLQIVSLLLAKLEHFRVVRCKLKN